MSERLRLSVCRLRLLLVAHASRHIVSALYRVGAQESTNCARQSAIAARIARPMSQDNIRFSLLSTSAITRAHIHRNARDTNHKES